MRTFATLVLSAAALLGSGREVAITIDDLPRGGDGGSRSLAGVRAMTERLLKPFRKERIPLIGFVNEGRQVDFGPQGLRQILDLWLTAGADLGNHSYSHLNINSVPVEEYIADIVKGEPILRAALAAHGKRLEFYRHPFLFTGPTPEIKREIQQFLDQHGYRVAPVTLDDSDYEYAALYTRPEYKDRVKREYVPYMELVVTFFEQRSVEVVGREIPQILLIHASQLNADLMPDLLAMFRRRGYTFVSLDQALADEAYRLPEEYVGRGGFSWIHRWSMTKGMKGRARSAGLGERGDRGFSGFVPSAPQSVPAIFEVVLIRSEDLELDGPVMAAFAKGSDAVLQIYRAGNERHVKIGGAALVVVQMHVTQSRAICVENLARRVVGVLQVGVPRYPDAGPTTAYNRIGGKIQGDRGATRAHRAAVAPFPENQPVDGPGDESAASVARHRFPHRGIHGVRFLPGLFAR